MEEQSKKDTIKKEIVKELGMYVIINTIVKNLLMY